MMLARVTSARSSSRWIEVRCVFLLLALVGLIWCGANNRWTANAWATPTSYTGDSLLALAYGKAWASGDAVLVLPKNPASLGAPFRANWNDYPTTEEGLFTWWGALGYIFGLFPGTNLFLMSAHMLGAAGFYFVCRRLHYDRSFAVAGALLFSFSAFAFWRGLAHAPLLFYWHIPLGLLVISWCVGRFPISKNRYKTIFCLVVAFIFGVQNPYYSWMWVQLLGLASIACLVRGRDRAQVIFPLILAALVLVTFALMSLDTLYFGLVHGRNPGAMAARSYADLDRYALKPVELFLPLAHRAAFVEDWLNTRYFSQTLFRGEIGSPYLGIVAIASMASMMWMSAGSIFRGDLGRVPSHSWAILWILAYSVVGGLNTIVGLFGVILFRGTNRFSIVILAALLLFFVRQATSLTRRLPIIGRVVAAGLVVAVGLWDQWPRFVTKEDVTRVSKQVAEDRELVQAIEAKLPRGALVFQLPICEFPEVPATEQMGEYEQLRPYLHSASLHFSYGSDKGRPRENWQREAQELGLWRFVAVLEQYGFSGLLIDKRGYKDTGVSLLSALRAFGHDAVISESQDFVCIALKPSLLPSHPPDFATRAVF
jgi:hypothetical protein